MRQRIPVLGPALSGPASSRYFAACHGCRPAFVCLLRARTPVSRSQSVAVRLHDLGEHVSIANHSKLETAGVAGSCYALRWGHLGSCDLVTGAA
jgi:hypothetical protein